MIDDYKTDLERAQSLQNILVATATGDREGGAAYKYLRTYFVNVASYNELLPSFVRTCREIGQFWQFIKEKFPSYAERRAFIWKEFAPLLDSLEGKAARPLDETISKTLLAFDPSSVHAAWQRALDRRTTDPEGAITSARTLLETVCKHILDARGVTYDPSSIELHELYGLVAKELRLSPSQHTESIFKQILGGCSAIVNGLGTMRNKLGDAHGRGSLSVRPATRHAELAVNLAGAVSLFLVSTWQARD
jgi:hypothetical protein